MQDIKKGNRQQLSKITQTIISPARIRRFIDSLGINKEVEEKLKECKNEINKVKKMGAPTVFEIPKNEKNNSELKALHEQSLKLYQEYKSDTYKELNDRYKAFKCLQKWLNILKRNPNLTSNSDESKNITDDLKKYEHLFQGVDLKNVNQIEELILKLRFYSGMNLLLEKDEISKQRIRFNDPAAVAIATAMELGIEELLELGMKNILKSQKKTLQPDNCIIGDMSNCNWFSFFKNLPHLNALLDRQKRKMEYNLEREKEKQKHILRSKKDKSRRSGNTKSKFEFPSFNDYEVSKGFARKFETKDKDETPKPYYQWYRIDIDEVQKDDNDLTNFHFYIQQLCRNLINQNTEKGLAEYKEIKISTNVRKFFSDLIIDFISKIVIRALCLIVAQ